MSGLYGTCFTAWAPGRGSREAWEGWARGAGDWRGENPLEGANLSLDFKEPHWRLGAEEMKTCKRRLSQISKMTLHVVHEIMPLDEGIKMVFISFRGEIGRQYRINKSLIKDREILPAGFSLSVFNTPPAAASIALGLEGGYTAIYPGDGRFDMGLLSAVATVQGGKAGEVLLVYADEQVPPEYGALGSGFPPPLALALLLSSRETPRSLPLDSEDRLRRWKNPQDFLRFLIQSGIPWGGKNNGHP